MIKLSCDNKDIPVNKITFSDGAITFKVNTLPKNPKYIWIIVDPSTPVYMVREELFLITDAILSNYDINLRDTEFNLSLEYLPYGRADRRFEKGNPSPLLDFFCTLRDDIAIFDNIYINDVHNIKVLPSGLNIIEKSQLQCFKDSLGCGHEKYWDVVVAPDKGATKKAKNIADYLRVDCVYANKNRELSTGKITKMVLPDYDFIGKKVLIPDDITDKAGTHMWLADLLKEDGVKQVDLYVTHAILPERFTKLDTSNIDRLIAYQTVGGYINKEDIKNFNLRKEK